MSMNEQSLDQKYELATQHHSSGNYDKCVSELKAMLTSKTKVKKEVYILLAVTYRKMGHYDQALETLKKGVKKHKHFI